MKPVDPELMKILVCPLTRSPLVQEGEELVAQRPAGAGLRYPVREGVPVMLMDQARLPAGCPDLAAFRKRYAGEIPD